MLMKMSQRPAMQSKGKSRNLAMRLPVLSLATQKRATETPTANKPNSSTKVRFHVLAFGVDEVMRVEWSNDRTHRRRANDVRIETAAQSRRSVQ